MQQWFNLSDPGMEDSLYDSESMRRFAQIELIDDAVPDESTILRFRHLLEQHQLTEKIFALVRGLLEQKRLLLKSGTIVDATIIDAPPSTKNEAKARDPEMKQGKKNAREWHFGMKAHIGTDVNGLVHTLVTTHAGASEFKQLQHLLHGGSGSYMATRPTGARCIALRPRSAGVRYRVNRRPNGHVPLSAYHRRLNRLRSAIRARGEHAFPGGEATVGLYQGALSRLAKNTARLFTMFALANLYMVRRRLLAT